MPAKLHHIHVRAPDPRKSAKWYVDNLGCKILGESDNNGVLFVRVDLGGNLINVTGVPVNSKPGPGDSSVHYGLEHFGVAVDDLSALMAGLKKKGVKVFQDVTVSPSGSKMAFIEGPDNVRIELLEVH